MTNIQKEIVYAQGGGRDLKLDLYRPAFGEKHHHSAVLLLHGGGWRMGDKTMMAHFGPELARLGFVAVAPEYRLLGEAPWPAQLEDVKAAIRWTRASAEVLDIHPDRIALQGFSAGAHLALMAGGTPGRPEFSGGGNEAAGDRVAAVIAFFPPTAFTTGAPSPEVSGAEVLLGDSATEAEARQASPVSYVSGEYPPTFLLHGTADQVVSFTASLGMFDALHKAGVAVELHLYPGHTHEFVRLPSMTATVMSEIALFLKRMVVDPEKYVKENRELNMFAR